MEKVKCKEWILETIDQLRKRKARPDLERICHMLERKHGITFEEVKADLDRLVETQIVIKVDYKGSTSYRNAAKWNEKQTARWKMSQIINQTLKEKITKAVGFICMENSQTGERKGASVEEIEKWLEEQKDEENPHDTFYEPKEIKDVLEKEVEVGTLQKTATNAYILGKTEEYKNEKSKGKNPVGRPSAKLGSPGKRGRPPNPHKRKRVKKTHGPDFESYGVVKISRQERRSSQNSSSRDTMEVDDSLMCDFCQQTSASNRKGEPEDLLICKDCQAKAHPSCMDYTEDLAKRARKSPWQCIDCKTCCICLDSGDADAMLFCDACDKGYHMDCHKPVIQDKPTGKWVCSQCVLELGVEDRYITDQSPESSIKTEGPGSDAGGPSCLPTPSDSPIQFPEEDQMVTIKRHSLSPVKTNGHSESPTKKNSSVSIDIPDASEWTIEDVVRYFTEIGFPDHADVFREQEIDGASLLLMKRMDVLTGLSLKLGPALKIHRHVYKLQSKSQGNI